MKENPSYQSIRRLLEKASLKPRKSDWNQMNVLLNKHLPPSGIHVNPLKFIKYFTGGASVVLITATVGFLHFHYSGKNKKAGHLTKPQDTINQLSESRRELPINEIFNKPGDSSFSASIPVQSEKITSLKINKLTSLRNPSIDQPLKKITKNKNDKSVALSNEFNKQEGSSVNSNQIAKKDNHPDAFLRKVNIKTSGYTPQPAITQSSKKATDYPVTKVRDESHKRKSRSEENYPISQELFSAGYSPDQVNIARRLQEDLVTHQPAFFTNSNKIKGEKEKNKTESSKTLNNPGNKMDHRHPPENAIFEYGINLPLFQYYTSKDMQTIRVNYIPGITTQYFFNDHWGLGIDINPYQTQNTNSKDTIFAMQKMDSAISINHYISNTYYIQNLNILKLNLHVNYRLNSHFGFELGFGYQHSYNGNGFVDSKIIPDTLQMSIPNQHVHYTGNDTAFAQVKRSNFYYFMNAVYSFDKFDIILGYNQNMKSWTKASPANPAGWISLELRYYFSRSLKK